MSPQGCGKGSSFARPGPVLSNLSMNSLKLSASNPLPSATTPQAVKPSPLAPPSPLSSLQIISPPAGFPIPGSQVEKISTPPVLNLGSPALSASVVFPVLQGWNDSSHSLAHEMGTTVVGTPVRNSIAQSTAMTLSLGTDIGSPALRNGSDVAFVSSGIAKIHGAPFPTPDTQTSAATSVVPISALQTESTSQLLSSSEKTQSTTISQGDLTLTTPATAASASPLPVLPPTTVQTTQTTPQSEASQTSKPFTTGQNALADVAAVFGAKFEQVASTLVPIPVAVTNIPGPTITSPVSVLDILPALPLMFKTLESSAFNRVASMLEDKYATVSTEPLGD